MHIKMAPCTSLPLALRIPRPSPWRVQRSFAGSIPFPRQKKAGLLRCVGMTHIGRYPTAPKRLNTNETPMKRYPTGTPQQQSADFLPAAERQRQPPCVYLYIRTQIWCQGPLAAVCRRGGQRSRKPFAPSRWLSTSAFLTRTRGRCSRGADRGGETSLHKRPAEREKREKRDGANRADPHAALPRQQVFLHSSVAREMTFLE